MQIEATALIARYRTELAQMTERALVAEAQVVALQEQAEQDKKGGSK